VHVWNGLAEVPADLRRSVVTLGNFDGVHRGHRAVLGQLVEQATSRDATSVAVTFEPHPLAVLFPERAPTPLTSLAQRLELLAGSGLDAVLVMEFTLEFARLTPEEFVEQVFVEALHAGAVIVGEDTRFGWKNSGNVDTLRELGASHDFDVIVLADLGDGERWSSTMARAQLAEGDVEGAAVVLGRPPSVCGTVVHGDHRGRELGYPTANLSPDAFGAIPADGVYAGWLAGAGGERLPAAISIGTNPTFDGTGRRVEAYVLDRDDLDLYGQVVDLEFTHRLRPTLRFAGVDDLVRQMAEDVARCRVLLDATAPA